MASSQAANEKTIFNSCAKKFGKINFKTFHWKT